MLMCVLTGLFIFQTLALCQVQIQEQQDQTVGQVLQVAAPSQQDLQGISTHFIQQGELTEEQQQQVLDVVKQLPISSALM